MIPLVFFPQDQNGALSAGVLFFETEKSPMGQSLAKFSSGSLLIDVSHSKNCKKAKTLLYTNHSNLNLYVVVAWHTDF